MPSVRWLQCGISIVSPDIERDRHRVPAARPLRAAKTEEKFMSIARKVRLSLLALLASVMVASAPATAQQQKPNILFIMGDDIGWMQPSIYHRGLMVGETP